MRGTGSTLIQWSLKKVNKKNVKEGAVHSLDKKTKHQTDLIEHPGNGLILKEHYANNSLQQPQNHLTIEGDENSCLSHTNNVKTQ